LEVDDWANNSKRYSLESFRDLCNQDRQAINERLRKLKEEQPASYGEFSEYEMV
jgi:hypothetical protein